MRKDIKSKKKKKIEIAELKLLQYAEKLLLLWMTECFAAATSLEWQMHNSPVLLKDMLESFQVISFRFRHPSWNQEIQNNAITIELQVCGQQN